MGRRRAVWGGAAGGRKRESPQAPDRVWVMLWLLPELRSAGKNASKAWDLCSRLCICFAMRLPFAPFTLLHALLAHTAPRWLVLNSPEA